MGPSVLVVGGGPCGLAAALGAARAGRSVELLEAAPRLGGHGRQHHRRRTARRPRQPPPPPVGGAEGACPARRAPRRRPPGAAPQRAAPPRWPLGGVPAAGPPTSCGPSLIGVGARIATDLVTGPLRRPRDGSYAEFVRAGLGPTALATFHGPMAAKLWGCDPSAIVGRARPTAHRRQRRRPSAASRRPWRQAGGTHVPLSRGSATARSSTASPRSAVVAGARIETGRRVRRARARSAGARHARRRAADRGRSRAVDRSAGRARRRGRRRPGRWHHQATAESCSSTSCSTRTATATSTPTTSRIPTSRSPASRSRRTTATARIRPAAPCSAPRCRRPSATRAGRRATTQLAQLVLDGMDRLGLRRPAVAGVEVVRLPRVYPVIARRRRRAAARAGVGRRPRRSLRARAPGPRRRRQPPSRHGHGARRGGMPRSGRLGRGEAGERSAPASTRSWWTTDGWAVRRRCSSVCSARWPRFVGIDARATYGARVSGDEPQYLLTATSIGEDGNLDIADEIAERRYRTYHEVDLDPQTMVLDDVRSADLTPRCVAASAARRADARGWLGGGEGVAGR